MLLHGPHDIPKVMRVIHNHGHTVVSGIKTIDNYVAFAKNFGNFVIQNDAEEGNPYVLVSEEHKLKKLGFSPLGLFPHTDRSVVKNPPDLVFLWCQQQAENGGESLIVDTREILENLNISNSFLYQKVLELSAVFSDENHSDFHYSKLFYNDGTSTYVRFRNDDYIFLPPKFYDTYNQLLILIMEKVVTYKMSSGDVLIVNNKRVLHGRNKFLGHRVLYRLHINTVEKMKGCV